MPSLQFEPTISPDLQQRIAASINAIIEAGGQIRLLAMLDDSISLTAGEVRKATSAGEDAGAPRNASHACPECGRTFKAPQGLAAHMRKHKRPAPPAADGARAPDGETIKGHVATGNHVCGICNQGGFRTSADLNRHISMAHRRGSSSTEPPPALGSEGDDDGE